MTPSRAFATMLLSFACVAEEDEEEDAFGAFDGDGAIVFVGAFGVCAMNGSSISESLSIDRDESPNREEVPPNDVTTQREAHNQIRHTNMPPNETLYYVCLFSLTIFFDDVFECAFRFCCLNRGEHRNQYERRIENQPAARHTRGESKERRGEGEGECTPSRGVRRMGDSMY